MENDSIDNLIVKIGIDNIVVNVNFNIEKCVICHSKTPYLRNTPISIRRNYIEGMGQICDKCSNESHKEYKELDFVPRINKNL